VEFKVGKSGPISDDDNRPVSPLLFIELALDSQCAVRAPRSQQGLNSCLVPLVIGVKPERGSDGLACPVFGLHVLCPVAVRNRVLHLA